jgi:hypothetical protein
MNKLLALAVVACGLYFAVPGQAKPPLGADNFNVKPRSIEITGTLEWVKGGRDPVWSHTHFTGYQITVNGTAYQLVNPGENAKSLLGKQVRVKGALTIVESIAGRISNGKPVQKDARIFTDHRVTVTEIVEVNAEYIRETVTVELRGKLLMHTWPGYPKFGEVAMIYINDQGYVLRFDNQHALEKFAAKYDGKTVVVRGSYGPNMSFIMKCKGDIVLPSIIVREIVPGNVATVEFVK